LLWFRAPSALALAATEAASGGGFAFRRSRSSVIDLPEGSTEEDLGLDPADTERCAWRDRNKALEAEAAAVRAAEEASARAWARAAEATRRGAVEEAWPEMPAGLEPAETIVMPATEEGSDPDGRVEMAVDDREVVEIGDDTPPRADMVERMEVEGGGGGAAPEGAPRATPDGAPQVAPEGALVTAPEGASVGAPEQEPAGGERALAIRQPQPASGSRPAAGSRQVQAGPSRTVFGPLTQEEASMAVVRHYLRGRAERVQAFAQAETERARELERSVFVSPPGPFFRSWSVGARQRTHWV
jgi:hypothetical protein